MYKPFPDDMNCPVCKKNLNKVALGELHCGPCMDAKEEALKDIAQTSVLGHLRDAGIALFNFEFINCLASLKWMQERIFKTGDYDRKTGIFYKKGYIKD